MADLEVKYGEMDGYSAEARAGELLLGVGIPVEQHYGPMSEVAPGWKLRVLLAQALVLQSGYPAARRDRRTTWTSTPSGWLEQSR